MTAIFSCGFPGWPSKKASINLGAWLKRVMPFSDGKTTSSCWMNQRGQNWPWRGHCIWKSPESFTIYFGKWILRTGMSTSTTFLLQTGRHYQNPKNQSTQCWTVPPVKYITLLCNLFPNASKLKPQRLVQDALAQNENKLNSKVKPTQKAIKSAVKHIYSKIDAPF